MDAVGSERAALLRFLGGRPDGALFAATYPERTLALVMYGTFAIRRTDDYPGDDGERGRRPRSTQAWGEGGILDVFAPSIAGDERDARGVRRATNGRRRARRWRARCIEMNREIGRHATCCPRSGCRRSCCTAGRVRPGRGRACIAARDPGRAVRRAEGIDHLPCIGDSDAIARRGRGVPHRGPARRRAGARAGDRAVHRHRRLHRARRRARRRALARAARAPRRARRAADRACPRARDQDAPATACSRRSTARRARSAAPPASSATSGATTSRSAPGSTPASASCSATTSPAWRSTSAPGSRRSPAAARCSSRSTVKDLVAGSEIEFEAARRARAQGRPRRVALFRRRRRGQSRREHARRA